MEIFGKGDIMPYVCVTKSKHQWYGKEAKTKFADVVNKTENEGATQ